eukprot:gene7708-5540_t
MSEQEAEALRELLAETNKEISKVQEECSLLAELILRKKLKNITEYRASTVQLTNRGRTKAAEPKEVKEPKEKKKREKKAEASADPPAKKPRKSSAKTDSQADQQSTAIVDSKESAADVVDEDNESVMSE